MEFTPRRKESAASVRGRRELSAADFHLENVRVCGLVSMDKPDSGDRGRINIARQSSLSIRARRLPQYRVAPLLGSRHRLFQLAQDEEVPGQLIGRCRDTVLRGWLHAIEYPRRDLQARRSLLLPGRLLHRQQAGDGSRSRGHGKVRELLRLRADLLRPDRLYRGQSGDSYQRQFGSAFREYSYYLRGRIDVLASRHAFSSMRQRCFGNGPDQQRKLLRLQSDLLQLRDVQLGRDQRQAGGGPPGVRLPSASPGTAQVHGDDRLQTVQLKRVHLLRGQRHSNGRKVRFPNVMQREFNVNVGDRAVREDSIQLLNEPMVLGGWGHQHQLDCTQGGHLQRLDVCERMYRPV